MAGRCPQPIFLDATVLSNYASTDSIGFLVSSLESPVVVPAVRDEIERGLRFGHDYLATAVEAFDDGLQIGDVPSEKAAGQLRDRLDPGETDALRGAVERNGTLATDDLAARRLADELGIPVTGSIGLLLVGIEHGRIDKETADEWLETWREERGYYAPVESVNELLDEEEPGENDE
jgi:predicted nucleic acid-binding protein